jgi:hypothetical protein
VVIFDPFLTVVWVTTAEKSTRVDEGWQGLFLERFFRLFNPFSGR